MKKLFGLALILFFAACDADSDNDTDTSDSLELTNPSDVQPPADAIPDSMRITNDSMIQPDPTGTGTSTQGTKHDSL